MRPVRILGIDPGLRATGWGVIDSVDNRLGHVANGTIRTTADCPLAERLVYLHRGLQAVMEEWTPSAAAVEVTLANKNPDSTLKLGMARGMALATPALSGVSVGEYLPMIVKKSVAGTGHADKKQVQMMVARLLPGCDLHSSDAADALAVAICHAHNLSTQQVWGKRQQQGLGK